MQEYVNGFMFSQDKKEVVLIKKLKPNWQKGLLNGIGGKIEQNETPIEAMVREFKEECVLNTTNKDWKHYVTIVGNDFKVYFFHTFNSNILNAKTMELEEVGIYSVDNLPKNIINNLKWLIPLGLDEKVSFSKAIEVKEIK